MRGQHYEPITDELKEKFLELIASGYSRPEAASALGASARQLRAVCNPESHRYDEEFARTYRNLTKRDGEQEQALRERLETAAIERGIHSSDRLLEKLLAIYHPAWEIHRPQAQTKVDINVDEIKVLMASASEATLRQLVADYEARRQLSAPADIEV